MYEYQIGDTVLVPAVVAALNGTIIRVEVGSRLMPTAINVPAAALIPAAQGRSVDGLTATIRAHRSRQEAIAGE
jgi:hypothetical protein